MSDEDEGGGGGALKKKISNKSFEIVYICAKYFFQGQNQECFISISNFKIELLHVHVSEKTQ